MATYKVIQDIEAEDKLLGPLSLRQFIYAGVCALCLYLSFLSVNKHVPFLLVIFGPVAIFTAFFAFPWKLNQPTEIWALAKIRFLFKPRWRIWNQSGIKELVTITAPKKVDNNYTNGLSQTEVKSRLKALASTIDSRGWVIKNVNVNLSDQAESRITNQPSDRLVDASTMPQEVSNVDVQAADDILDERSNPVAQNFDRMIHAASATHRQQIVQQLREQQVQATNQQPLAAVAQTPPSNYWYAQQPEAAAVQPQVAEPATTTDEANLAQQLKVQRQKPDIAYAHLRTLRPAPMSRAGAQATRPAKQAPPMTQTPDPAILNLAGNNDLNVATLARQANQKELGSSPDEVVISLH